MGSEKELIKKAILDSSAREELFFKYEKYIYKIVSKYKNSGMDIEDLKSEAIIGFYYTISKYDAKKRIKFDTYATYWIKERILLSIKNNNRKVAIPYNKLNTIQKIKKIDNELNEKNYDENRKEKYICDELHLSKNELNEYKSVMQPLVCIDDACNLTSRSGSAEEEYEKIYIRESIEAAILELGKSESRVIVEFYFNNKSLKEIKIETSHSYSEIKLLMKSGLEKMKEYLLSVGIDG